MWFSVLKYNAYEPISKTITRELWRPVLFRSTVMNLQSHKTLNPWRTWWTYPPSTFFYDVAYPEIHKFCTRWTKFTPSLRSNARSLMCWKTVPQSSIMSNTNAHFTRKSELTRFSQKVAKLRVQRAQLEEETQAHMIQEQLLSSLTNSGLSLLTLPPASNNSAPLQRRCTPIKHKHRLDTQKEQLANPAEEPQQVSISDHVTTIITHCLHELNDPYARICRHTHIHHSTSPPSPTSHKGQHPHTEPHPKFKNYKHAHTYSQLSTPKRLHRNASPNGSQQLPQTMNSHVCSKFVH